MLAKSSYSPKETEGLEDANITEFLHGWIVMVSSALARSRPDQLMDGLGLDHFGHILDHYLVPALDPQLQLVVLAVLANHRPHQ